MADAPEIKVKLTAEDTGVASAIRALSDRLKDLKKQQDETTSSAELMSKAFTKIAGIGAAIGIEEFGRAAFDSAVNIGKMADKTGISTQTLSVFHKVAEDVGASTEAVDKGLQKAAKSITEFETGTGKSAKAFQILNLSAKDFAGLNSDQKIRLVTERLGTMEKGFAKATATQLIFGKGGGDLALVLNSLAAQGFDKATEATSKLGLLLDQTTTDDFRAAKAAMQELEDVGKGMATQFEAGLLPAISDIGEALASSLTQGGVSFKDIGKVAGDVVRGIALIFLGLGQTLGSIAESIFDVYSQIWREIKNEASTTFQGLGELLKGHIERANQIAEAGTKRSAQNLTDAFQRQKAIFGALADSFKSDYENLFPSAEEEERRRKDRIAKLRVDKDKETKPVLEISGPTDAAARAALALLEKQLQDQLAIQRAYARQSEQIDAELFEKGELSLTEYYDLRRALVKEETEKELATLQQGLAAAQAAVQKAAADKAKASTPKEADKQEAARLQALAKVDELQTKITEAQINSTTKITALNAEQFKKNDENQQKILAFEKEIEKTNNDKRAAAQEEIELETQRLALVLRQQGLSQQQVDAELARFRVAKEAQADFAATQEEGAAQLKILADQRAAIEDRVKTGQEFEITGQEEIRSLEQSRLPVLQKIADALVAQAKASGDEAKIAQAEDFSRQVNQITVQANYAGQQIATLKQGLQTSLQSGFTNFFTSLAQGTRGIGDAFRNLAGSVISSLQQIAAQMLAQLILTKLLKSALGGFGFSGGGLVPAAGHADGGLIKGPGGPKADAIPARLSDGEFVVRADAVKKFGVGNLEAINRGIQIPSLERLSLPKFSEGGLVGNVGGGGGDSQIRLGIGLDEGLILKHLSSRQAGNIILQHLSNNPKAAQKALSRSD